MTLHTWHVACTARAAANLSRMTDRQTDMVSQHFMHSMQPNSNNNHHHHHHFCNANTAVENNLNLTATETQTQKAKCSKKTTNAFVHKM